MESDLSACPHQAHHALDWKARDTRPVYASQAELTRPAGTYVCNSLARSMCDRTA
jgi:hypothetical protein